MGIAFHKKTNSRYVKYTFRVEEAILDRIKQISTSEDLSINEVLNQSLLFAIEEYDNKSKK